jgi:hypothetical protein
LGFFWGPATRPFFDATCIAEFSILKRHEASAPRRYFVDGRGQRVLIGLSIEETTEFERLEVVPALDATRPASAMARAAAMYKHRWSELYAKHDSAWRAWISQTQVDRAG